MADDGLAEVRQRAEGLRAALPDRSTQRLNLYPGERLLLAILMAGGYGLMNGIVKGGRISSLRYLAENAHRLPRTKGTWYFFHKRKNYVVMKDGLNQGFVTAVKFSSIAAGFVGAEAYFDHLQGNPNFLSTVGAATAAGLGLTLVKRLGRGQIMRSTRNYALFGAAVGGIQDILRYLRSQQTSLQAKRRLQLGEDSQTLAVTADN